MKTRTERYGLYVAIDEINYMEDAGWRVKQIVADYDQTDFDISKWLIVVFERDV